MNAKQLKIVSNFVLKKDIEKLKKIWELGLSNSKAPFQLHSPLVDNLQIHDPFNLDGLNLIEPKKELIQLLELKY